MNASSSLRILRGIVLRPALSLALAAAAAHVSAQSVPTPNPPGQISYQGFLTDANGAPLATTAPKNYDVNFRLYTNATGSATAIWGEIQTVTVDKGYFSVMLGQGAALTSGELWTNNLTSVFTGPNASDRYLGITVKGLAQTDSEIQPRLRMLASPYSFLSAYANSLISSAGGQLITASGTPAVASFVNGLSIAAGNLRLNDRPLYFRGGSDTNHGMAYGLAFPTAPDGPAIWGNLGGVLGTVSGTARASLTWNSSGDITVRGNVGGNTLSGNGVNISSLNANNVTTGTLSDSRLSGNVALLNNDPTFSAGLGIGQGNTIEFGAGVAGKQPDAGKIGYGTFTTGSLDIVGAGTASSSRKIKLWGEGGVTVSDSLGIGTAPARPLHVSGAGFVVERVESSNAAGTWLSLGNSSVGGTFWQFISSGSGNGEGAGKLLIGTGSSDGFTSIKTVFQSDGKVGIGTSAPSAPLEVSGSATLSKSYGYLSPSGTVGTANGSNPYSIIASARIGAVEFNAFSDRRIKDVVGASDTKKDLETIEKLRVTDYRMVDKVAAGEVVHKGFIAQEVQKIVPEAVTKSTGFVPDIYARAEKAEFDKQAKTLKVTMAKAHGLLKGDTVRMFAGETTIESKVIAVDSEKEFVAEHVVQAPETVFVFGKRVDDFLSVDYNRLFTSGVGAIQELAKEVQYLKANQTRFAELEKKAARVDNLEKEVAKLKKMIVLMNDRKAIDRQTASTEK